MPEQALDGIPQSLGLAVQITVGCWSNVSLSTALPIKGVSSTSMPASYIHTYRLLALRAWGTCTGVFLYVCVYIGMIFGIGWSFDILFVLSIGLSLSTFRHN